MIGPRFQNFDYIFTVDLSGPSIFNSGFYKTNNNQKNQLNIIEVNPQIKYISMSPY